MVTHQSTLTQNRYICANQGIHNKNLVMNSTTYDHILYLIEIN